MAGPGASLLEEAIDGALQPQEIVVIGRYAVLDIEGPAAEPAALRDQRAVAAALWHFDLGGDRLGTVLHVDECALQHPRHAFGESQRGAARHQLGPSDGCGVQPLEDAVIHGQDAIFGGFREEQRLQLGELLRVLRRDVAGKAEVRSHVVKLPGGIVLQAAAWLGLPRCPVDGARIPAIMVDGAVAGDLEILRGVAFLGTLRHRMNREGSCPPWESAARR